MGHKRILVALLATAALFGAAVSGCNQNRDADMASADSPRARAQNRGQLKDDIQANAAVRPAEVLASSVHRTSLRNTRVAGVEARRQARQTAQHAYQQDPRARQYPQQTVAYNAPRPAAQQTYQLQSGPAFAAPGAAPVYNQTSVPAQPRREYAQPAPVPAQTASPFISEAYMLVPSQTQPGFYEKVYDRPAGYGAQPVNHYPAVPHPTPALTMARAQLQGSAPLSDTVAFPETGTAAPAAVVVPLPTPEAFPVPIPELEPMRYRNARPARRAGPVAVAPLPAIQSVPSVQGWVASPATAMRAAR